VKILNSLTIGVVALTGAALSGVAHGQEARVSVGDLSQPVARAAFERQMAKATEQFCGARWDHLDRQISYRDCVSAIHAEIFGQLTPAHRAQYAAGQVTAPAAPVRLAAVTTDH